MKIGDKVRLVQWFNGFDCSIFGTIISFYRSDRVIVRSKTGHDWALKKSQVEKIKN